MQHTRIVSNPLGHHSSECNADFATWNDSGEGQYCLWRIRGPWEQTAATGHTHGGSIERSSSSPGEKGGKNQPQSQGGQSEAEKDLARRMGEEQNNLTFAAEPRLINSKVRMSLHTITLK